jgi:peptidoglycan lytic transglycosylase
MGIRLAAFASILLATSVHAETFEDLWLTRIKPPPYEGIATRFDDTRAFDGTPLDPNRQFVCAHMLEQIGQRLRVTNVENGKSVICTVADRGPSRKFWPRREVDLFPLVDRAIGCEGMCKVTLERVAE